LCEAIAAALDPNEFEIFWDRNFETSTAWRSAIDEWIWRCDAAILVLSEAATQSSYVGYEAAMLRQRWKHAGGQFTLIPTKRMLRGKSENRVSAPRTISILRSTESRRVAPESSRGSNKS